MKRLFLVILTSIFIANVWGQKSTVVEMGEAISRSNNFEFAKTLLQNEGLIVDKSVKGSFADIVYTNASNSTYSILKVELTKRYKSKKVAQVVFKFHPNGKFFKNIARDIRRFGYISDDEEFMVFQEFYSNGKKHIGINLDEKGWMEMTFYNNE